ncbi:hypothetical protein COW36_06610 [bacterium (Candidatus Blackallbacteria) CG17_big_fil_post_rev_8_21_14_2_50_48_46]|uniref:N-acetylmuramoyl-L-alanine amidase domain-containing protein n=1 Tax=bacterium (Candidatus Blackallbacteria) CG17_big_fil_post_rev_8_21_14_2_50_48_46 TaxID=2014261 RepID=A0A2M7G7F1_9BACT|nr:MAG: hypothetical protein COW64_23005 [bacterium (Candidatus Blackallbacteria) CG18_big_fil_WC_8_21_14_2_50_49_26]PIW18009.1 MAG: hypothetical protein COW36_06610 [bacterium (Candidatus Blackallbacteria) CG17_big_fil_post_rev_8_21_14_2_50_48_46]PIW49654.1 MAG: hypothetical protein COW20_05330 [bacterium (Candidatus Blackallbacteria) CG13_big_fil_rev_8_21_14_2_50_49_14]
MTSRHIPGVSLHWPGETRAQILASPGDSIVKRWRAAHMGAPNYWRDIGYHYVLNRDAQGEWAVYDGRPDYLAGAHSGTNAGNEYLGINVAYAMDEQLPGEAVEALAKLIAELSKTYGFPINRATVRGHREFIPTQCPGDALYSMLNQIVQRANQLRTGPADEPLKPEPSKEEEQIHPIRIIKDGKELRGVLINSQAFVSVYELGKPKWDSATRTVIIE